MDERPTYLTVLGRLLALKLAPVLYDSSCDVAYRFSFGVGLGETIDAQAADITQCLERLDESLRPQLLHLLLLHMNLSPNSAVMKLVHS
jgi:hypothetical protein